MALTYKCLKLSEDDADLQVSEMGGRWLLLTSVSNCRQMALTYKCLILSEYVADLQVSEIVGKWP